MRFNPLPRIASSKRATSFMAAAVSGLALTAAGSHAQDRRVDPSALPVASPGCGTGVAEETPFIVTRADGGTRTIGLCGSEEAAASGAKARALSAAIDADGKDQAIDGHSRMPELLSLRLARARTHVDPSLSAEDRSKNLAALNGQIIALEKTISGPTPGK